MKRVCFSCRECHLATVVLVLVMLLLVAGCAAPLDPTALGFQGMAAASTPSAADDVEPATATVSTRSLRVRAAPSEQADVVAGAREGESFPVIGISSDGLWVEIEVERAVDGRGWVSAGLVRVEGDITDVELVQATEASTATEQVATAPAEDTPEPAEEATPAENTPEPAEEATPAENTPEPAEEAAPAEDTPEPAEEATPAENTPEPAEEATPAPLAEPEPGFAVVTAETPLRVRSAPDAEADNKIGNVFYGESYRVLEVSEDGAWIRLEVPELDAENGGWVAAEFMLVGAEQ